MEDIFTYLREHQDEMLGQVERLVREDSPSTNKRLVDQCGQTICELFLSNLSVSPEVLAQREVGNHLVFRVGSGQTKVLILGHFDTVWDQGVLSFRIEGNRAYGPGIFDMKAGIVQGMWALKAIRDCHYDLNAEVTFLLTTDEEIGSGTSQTYIEDFARNMDSVYVLEPSVGKTGAIKTARKGAFIYTIEARGISAHAGNHPEDGASAVHEMSRQVVKIVDEVQSPSLGTTVNVGTIQGGTRTNVVAERASCQVEVRVSEMSEVHRVDQYFKELVPYDSRVRLSVRGGLNRPPLVKSERAQSTFHLAQQIAVQRLGVDLREAGVGGGSDGNFTSALGIPTLDGLGAVGDGPHAEHEHIIIDGLSQRSALLAHLLLADPV